MTKIDLGPLAPKALNIMNAERAVAMKLIEISDPFVPFLSGSLAGKPTVHAEPGKVQVIYEQPYAAYQYVGLSMLGRPLQHTTKFHPQATSHWDVAARNANPGVLEQTALEALGFAKQR